MASSAPRRWHAAHFSSEPAVANTRAPNARAIWIAVVPMPLVPPWTRNDSPLRSRPRSKTFIHTVKNVSGIPAAATRSTPPGSGRHCTSGATQYSAYPPPDTSAQTRSPSRQRATLSPHSAITPDTSRPGISLAPGGGGYFPSRCMRSGRFTPAAATRMSTSRGPGRGIGNSTGRSTSGVQAW